MYIFQYTKLPHTHTHTPPTHTPPTHTHHTHTHTHTHPHTHTHRWCSIWARTLVVPPRPKPIYSPSPIPSPIVGAVTVTSPHPLRSSYEYHNYRPQWKCVNVLVAHTHSPGRLHSPAMTAVTAVTAPPPLLEKRDSGHSQIVLTNQGTQGMLWLCT